MKKSERIRDLEVRVGELERLAAEDGRAIDVLVKQVESLQRILKRPALHAGVDLAGHYKQQVPEVRRAANTSKETGSGMPVVQATTADECGDVRDLPSPPIAAEASL